MRTFELSLRNAIMHGQLAINCDTVVQTHSRPTCCSPHLLFPCHHFQPMLTWFVRSTFRPGDKLNVTYPDPSSSPCEGSGSKTSYTINIPLLKCLVVDYLCSAATVRLNPHCSVQVVYILIESQSWTDNKPWIQIDFSPTPYPLPMYNNWARST